MPVKKMTMGLIVGNRGFFPDHLAKSGREEMLRVLAAAGMDVVALTPEESKYGAVETREESRRCAELFKKHREKMDGVIVTLPNFGEERAIADTLRLADLHVPVLIQATPDDPKKMTIASRRDSFCGKMSACNNLRQYGIPYSITSLHTESPGFAGVREGSGVVCGGVPGGEWVPEFADRGDRGAAHGVQHRALQREDSGSQPDFDRDAGFVRGFGADRADEGWRRCGAGETGVDQEVCGCQQRAGSGIDEDGETGRGGGSVDGGDRGDHQRGAVLDLD